jgi:GNAT superfamily N-acetyltransferase
VSIVDVANVFTISKLCDKIMSVFAQYYGRDIPLTPEQFYSILFNLPKHQNIFVAIRKNTTDIMGVCTLSIEHTLLCSGKNMCMISDIIVVPEKRKLGIGTLILNYINAYAMLKDCHIIRAFISRRLTLEEEEACHEFFTHNYYRPVIHHGVYEYRINNRR